MLAKRTPSNWDTPLTRAPSSQNNLFTIGLLTIVLCVFQVDEIVLAAEFRASEIDGPFCLDLNNSGLAGCVSIYMSGPIEPGDADKLLQIIDHLEQSFGADFGNAHMRVGNLHLDSPGGDLEEAVKIGRILRTRLMAAKVATDFECYSSCVISLVGGVHRAALGKTGIHSFSSAAIKGSNDYSDASTKFDAVAKLLREYMAEMRIPESFLDEMLLTRYDKLRLLTRAERERFGLYFGLDPVYAQMRDGKGCTKDQSC